MSEKPNGKQGVGDVLFAVAAIAVVVIAVALAAFWSGRNSAPAETASGPASARPTPVSEQVAVGARTFSQFACAQCHGPQGDGSVSADVPGLQAVASTLTAKQL